MRTSTLISSWPAKSELEFRRYQSFAFGRVGSIAALNKFTVSLSVIVPHIKSFYWNARTISELLYIEEPVNWRLTVFFRKCPLLSPGRIEIETYVLDSDINDVDPATNV